MLLGVAEDVVWRRHLSSSEAADRPREEDRREYGEVGQPGLLEASGLAASAEMSLQLICPGRRKPSAMWPKNGAGKECRATKVVKMEVAAACGRVRLNRKILWWVVRRRRWYPMVKVAAATWRGRGRGRGGEGGGVSEGLGKPRCGAKPIRRVTVVDEQRAKWISPQWWQA